MKLENEGYRCMDFHGTGDSVTFEGSGDAKWFTYIRCRGPDCYVHEIICVKSGRVTAHTKGKSTRLDSAGGYYTWEDVFEVTPDGAKRVWGRTEYHPDTNRIERIPATKMRDVRDLYPL